MSSQGGLAGRERRKRGAGAQRLQGCRRAEPAGSLLADLAELRLLAGLRAARTAVLADDHGRRYVDLGDGPRGLGPWGETHGETTALGETGDDVQTHPGGDLGVDVAGHGQAGVEVGELRRGNADTGVCDLQVKSAVRCQHP
jgi:hypothetical protein